MIVLFVRGEDSIPYSVLSNWLLNYAGVVIYLRKKTEFFRIKEILPKKKNNSIFNNCQRNY